MCCDAGSNRPWPHVAPADVCQPPHKGPLTHPTPALHSNQIAHGLGLQMVEMEVREEALPEAGPGSGGAPSPKGGPGAKKPKAEGKKPSGSKSGEPGSMVPVFLL